MGPPSSIRSWLKNLLEHAPFLRFAGMIVLLVGVAELAWVQSERDPIAEHFRAAQVALRSGDLPIAESEYKAFLAEAIHRAGNARAQAGDLQGAANSLQQASAISGNDRTVLLDYASVLFDQGRFKEAEDTAQSAVKAAPNNAAAQVLLGRILFEEKDYSAASAHLQMAADTGKFREAWRTLALAYLRLQQVDRARQVLNHMIAETGDTPQSRIAAATVYYYGDYSEVASDELRKITAQHPSAPNAHYFLGLAYLAKNEEAEYEKAIPEFRAELRIEPDDFRSHYMLGYIRIKQHRFEEAEPELQRAHALSATDEGTQLLLAELYSETNRQARAEEILRSLIDSRPQSVQPSFVLVRAHYMLGRLLRNGGKFDEGTEQIKISEELRRQLRANSQEAEQSRVREPIETESASRVAGLKSAAASSAEQANAQAFIAQISPLIGEAYYNLAGIAAQRKDSSTSAQYLQRAVEWDPSLAKVQR